MEFKFISGCITYIFYKHEGTKYGYKHNCRSTDNSHSLLNNSIFDFDDVGEDDKDNFFMITLVVKISWI